MQYDPIKRSLGNVFNKNPFLRKLFYRLLDLLLLRAWHVHKELKSWIKAEAAVDSRQSAGKNNLQILDAGAGYGQYSFWLNQRVPNADILAVDVKEEQVADCNKCFHFYILLNHPPQTLLFAMNQLHEKNYCNCIFSFGFWKQGTIY